MGYNASAVLKTFIGGLVASALQDGWSTSQNASSFRGYGKVADCSLTGFVPSFPSGQTALVVPPGEYPSFIGLAFGVQNYTCTQSNNYTNIGAVAEILDLSCHVKADWFGTIQNEVLPAWQELSQTTTIQQVIDFVHFLNPPYNLAQHYFVTNPVTGVGVSPKWDFTSSGKFEGNPEAFMIGKVNGTLASPNNATTDITWLEVLNVEGSIASEVFRYDTVGGQPPSSCQYGKDTNISVDYTAKYIFYGGSL